MLLVFVSAFPDWISRLHVASLVIRLSIFAIFHIFRLFLVCHNLQCLWIPQSFPFHKLFYACDNKFTYLFTKKSLAVSFQPKFHWHDFFFIKRFKICFLKIYLPALCAVARRASFTADLCEPSANIPQLFSSLHLTCVPNHFILLIHTQWLTVLSQWVWKTALNSLILIGSFLFQLCLECWRESWMNLVQYGLLGAFKT